MSLLERFIIFSRTLIRESSPRNEESFDLEFVFCRATKTRFAFFSFCTLFAKLCFAAQLRDGVRKKSSIRSGKNSTMLVFSSF